MTDSKKIGISVSVFSSLIIFILSLDNSLSQTMNQHFYFRTINTQTTIPPSSSYYSAKHFSVTFFSHILLIKVLWWQQTKRLEIFLSFLFQASWTLSYILNLLLWTQLSCHFFAFFNIKNTKPAKAGFKTATLGK